MAESEARHITIVVPILNEAECVDRLLDSLLPLCGSDCKLVLVDGGSQDGTVEKIRARAEDLLVTSVPGRAHQLAAGVSTGIRDIVWFLHVDSRIPANALTDIRSALVAKTVWGRFDIRLSGQNFAFRIIERMINLRSRTTGICTGDQGMFMTYEALCSVGGVPMQPLMEDVELAKRLKKASPPACLRSTLMTSSRRWEEKGVVKTILLMFWLRFCYFVGVSPERLVRLYYRPKP